MASTQLVTTEVMQEWLEQAGTEFYLCNQCDGIHLRSLQDTEGVIDSRLFLEEFGLLLTTEVELRPSAVLAIVAELGRLNMDYPTLKIFVDLVDEALPQLVVAGNLPIGSRLTQDQFIHFVAMTVEATAHLVSACGEWEYLFIEPETATDTPRGPLLH
jgi:hypothetical protein